MPTPIDASSLGIDFGHLAPEIILTLTAIAVVLTDLVARDKRILAWLSVAGVVVAGAAAVWLWTSDASGSSYSGVVITDLFGTFFKLVVLGGTLLALLFSPAYVERRLPRFHGEYYGLLLLATVGMMLLVSMGELISIVLALEIQTFALVALIALLKDARSTESALKFLLLSAVATAVMLYGMAILFGLTGTTFIADMPGVIAERVAEGGIANNLALILAGVLIIVGFGFKISSVPFQMWVPPVYEGAPTPIVGYLSVVSKAAGFAVLVRVFMIAFRESGLEALDWPLLIGALAIASMTIGNIVAIVQTNIKRLLAYSTIAQAGYILIGVAVMGSGGSGVVAFASMEEIGNIPIGVAVYELATSGVLFYLAAYTLSNLAAFGAVIALTPPNDDDSIENLTGGFARSPFAAIVLSVALISLVGLPPTGLFVGKIYLFYGAVQGDLWWLALAGALNSFVSAYYYLRPARRLWQSGGPTNTATESSRSISLRISMAISVAGVILLGIVPFWLINRAIEAASSFTP